MGQSTILAVIDLLERAQKPDRNLDLEIHKAVGLCPANAQWSTKEQEEMEDIYEGIQETNPEFSIPILPSEMFPAAGWETPAYAETRRRHNAGRKEAMSKGAAAVGAFYAEHDKNPPKYDWKKDPPCGPVPHYTGSFDAAVKLIGEERRWQVRKWRQGQWPSRDYAYTCEVFTEARTNCGRGGCGSSSMAASAICVAALKAGLI